MRHYYHSTANDNIILLFFTDMIVVMYCVLCNHAVRWYLIAGRTQSGDEAFGPFVNTSFIAAIGPAVIFDRKSAQVWMLGGRRSSSETNYIYTSTDMIRWSLVQSGETRFSARSMAVSGIDSTGIMFLATGRYNYGVCSDVWMSPDAVTWTLTCQAAPFLPRQEAQMAIVPSAVLSRDILTIIGGYRSNWQVLFDCWMSSDFGETWIETHSLSNFVPRIGFALGVVATSNMLVLAFGTNANQELYISIDGALSWQSCAYDVPPVHAWVSSVFTADGYLMIVGGYHSNQIWRSSISFNNYSLVLSQCFPTDHPVQPPFGLPLWPTANYTAHWFNTSNELDDWKTISATSLAVSVPNIMITNTITPQTILMSGSGSIICILRADHSIMCTDPINSAISTSLSSSCSWSADSTYQCGIGRTGIDGLGWIGSANGNMSATANTATGFSYISLCAVKPSSVGVFLLTAIDHYPTHYGSSSMQWNTSLNPIQYTDQYCISPIFNVSWNKCLLGVRERGDRWQGDGDLPHFEVTSDSKCASACCSNTLCVAYVTVNMIWADSPCSAGSLCCYLKASITPFTPTDNSNTTVVYQPSSLLRSIPIRRHIPLHSLLRTSMQSVCGDAEKACGLTMSGVIICWHSHPTDDAPITVSPPGFMRFSQLTCGIDAQSLNMTYACALTANIGLTNRMICWDVSGYRNELQYLKDTTYWMYAEMFTQMEPVLRETLWNEWRYDTSVSGYESCINSAPSQPLPALMTAAAYNRTTESSVVRAITQTIVVKSVTCPHLSDYCSFIATNDTIYRTNYRFTVIESIDTANINAHSLLHAVSLNNTMFDTLITTRTTDNANSSIIIFDQVKTISNNQALYSLYDRSFMEQFDDSASAALCVLTSQPLRGQIVCNKSPSAHVTAFSHFLFHRIRYAVAVPSAYPKSISDVCGQRMNDSQWMCGAAPNAVLSNPLLSQYNVTASVVVPVTSGAVPAFTRTNTATPLLGGILSKTITFPRPITFIHTNGTTIVLPSNSIVYFAATNGYPTVVAFNDIWASSDLGNKSVLCTHTSHSTTSCNINSDDQTERY